MNDTRRALCLAVELDPIDHVFEYPEVVEYFKQGELGISSRRAVLRIGAVSLISYGDDSVDALRRLVYMCKAISVEYSLMKQLFLVGGNKE